MCKFTETIKVVTAAPHLGRLRYKSDFKIHTSNRICLNCDTCLVSSDKYININYIVS